MWRGKRTVWSVSKVQPNFSDEPVAIWAKQTPEGELQRPSGMVFTEILERKESLIRISCKLPSTSYSVEGQELQMIQVSSKRARASDRSNDKRTSS